MIQEATLTIDGIPVALEGERNLLEVARKAGIEIPTFCYHSELSVYGACRLCLVEIEGRGVVASCSVPPEAGMVVRTNTEQVRGIRRIAIELLLANHEQQCPTCAKSDSCQLQALARRLGVDEVRFQRTQRTAEIDRTSPAIVRDPNKCILCGDCVRMCHEVQGLGAIDFAYRGSAVTVLPAFGKDLKDVECVHCGQCARVCPTGALTPASEIEAVWKAIENPDVTVVAQIAPAVRVAVGEMFGLEPGTVLTGQIVAALKRMGFDQVYDTSFAADLTVLEEATEFLHRVEHGEKLPQFTSCCPAWVVFAEQYYPELLPHLSSCRSPQQMFGALAKSVLPKQQGVKRENLFVVSIMPCTAKKYEARREEFALGGQRDVDAVLTTQELGRMIEQAGLRFRELAPESLDMPFGFKTGAGVIFGSTGGVTEAVLRYAHEALTGETLHAVDFHAVRGQGGVRTAEIKMGAHTLRLAIAHGLTNARKLAESVRKGECPYDIIEVMACPGGCVGGAGQPCSRDPNARHRRAAGLYETDKTLQLHKSQDNPMLARCYKDHLGEPGGHRAHELLHTEYQSRRRIFGQHVSVSEGPAGDTERLPVGVCVGTGCHVRGSQDLLRNVLRWLDAEGLNDRVDVQATFCFEQCSTGPNVAVGDRIVNACTLEKVQEAVREALVREAAEKE